MNTFNLMIHAWTIFFTAIAEISGSLFGLVFVALTFNQRLLGARKDSVLGLLANQIFADFILLLLISLVMLAPHTTADALGKIILASTVIGGLRLLLNLWRVWEQLLERASRWTLLPSDSFSRSPVMWCSVGLAYGSCSTTAQAIRPGHYC